MAVAAYLFLFAISFTSGTFSPVNQNELPAKIQSKFSFQSFLDACRLRQHSTFQCYLELNTPFNKTSESMKPKLERNALKTNSRNSITRILKENNNKEINKPESYINSILDEDKRDVSNFNESENFQNSSSIEIKDPRKTDNPLKIEIANVQETDEFVSLKNENKIIRETTDSSIAEEKEGKTNGTETTTEMQQNTKITESSDIITSELINESTVVNGETSDITVTKELSEKITTSNHDSIFSREIDEENKGYTNLEKKKTGVFSTKNAERSTTSNLHTERSQFGFEVKIENTTVNESDIKDTTEKIIEDKFSSSKENLPVESRSTLTSVVSVDLNNVTTLATDDFTTSTIFTTLSSMDPIKSESVSDSDVNTSLSSKTESSNKSSTVIFSIASVTESSGYKTQSRNGGFVSTMITDSKSFNDDYVTKSTSFLPEHTINIRSIKIARTVLSVLLLMTGLIAVIMLAVYLFRVRRGVVQYDQLTLLP